MHYSIYIMHLLQLTSAAARYNGTVRAWTHLSGTHGTLPSVSLTAYDDFAESVAYMGDINSDGYPDIAVGAREDDDGGDDRGAVWILFLNQQGTLSAA